jgi:hypothetical protein
MLASTSLWALNTSAYAQQPPIFIESSNATILLTENINFSTQFGYILNGENNKIELLGQYSITDQSPNPRPPNLPSITGFMVVSGNGNDITLRENARIAIPSGGGPAFHFENELTFTSATINTNR